ncbi:TPA: hypothetical protein N2A65_005799 [Pseudomonas aeruginosa]|nr:hypothetical protein [Pseudomonas aeruginosa]
MSRPEHFKARGTPRAGFSFTLRDYTAAPGSISECPLNAVSGGAFLPILECQGGIDSLKRRDRICAGLHVEIEIVGGNTNQFCRACTHLNPARFLYFPSHQLILGIRPCGCQFIVLGIKGFFVSVDFRRIVVHPVKRQIIIVNEH